MQFSKLAFLAAMASSVTAQAVTISDLPSCALAPAVSAISTTGCGSDIACVCKNSSFLTSLSPQIKAACSDADYKKAVEVAVQLCAQSGVTITPATAAPSTAAPVSSAPASSAPASTSIATTSAVAAPTSSAAVTSAVTTATVPKNVTVSTSAVPSVVTANVAAARGTWAAAGLLGVGALLAAL